jgi:immune inhibitor InhA-like protein
MDRVRFGFLAVVTLITPSFGVMSTSGAAVASPHAAAASPHAAAASLHAAVPTSPAGHGARPAAIRQAQPSAPRQAASDIRELNRTDFTLDGHRLPEPRHRPHANSRRPAAATPAVGTVREWLGLNDTTGKYYRKNYTLRATGKHIEVWVAQDLAFPADDCRKGSISVTDTQVTDLIKEFDGTIYPKETVTFSTPPPRDGADAAMDGDFTGDGDKTVTLVDNVRDPNYYHFPDAVTYIAGFFSPQLNELFDRNVMTIDAYDWLHRMGANPPSDPTDDLCTSRPAHPRMYEGTFAHEWQHLLEYYADPDEVVWANEGLSDYAQTLTGYVDARATIDQSGYDNHITCFQGFGTVRTKYNINPRVCGGPQNSLNLWDEGAPADVLADYGNAYQFMVYLADRFGPDIITRLHRDGAHHGLAGVAAVLPPGTGLYETLHDFQTMTLVDRIVDRPGGTITGIAKSHVIAAGLRSTVNLANPAAYETPGAAPNGADYVPLPTPLRSVTFRGASYLPPLPTGWTVADGTLFSGNKSDLDNSAVLPISVPTTDPTLRMETAWDLEDSYDYAYVEASTDGGRSYAPVAGDRTVTGTLGPALTAASNGTVAISFSLSAYAGKNVLLALRYVSDGAVNSGGWRIGKLTLGTTVLSDGSSLKGWKSPTDIVPTAVAAWHVTLVGLAKNHVAVVPLERFAELSAYSKIVAVVAYDEPTEHQTQYAPYTLTANGRLQPGGAPLP